jgi:hypothetical protein
MVQKTTCLTIRWRLLLEKIKRYFVKRFDCIINLVNPLCKTISVKRILDFRNAQDDKHCSSPINGVNTDIFAMCTYQIDVCRKVMVTANIAY